MTTLSELRDRTLRLRSDSTPTDKDAERTLRRIAIQAAQLYHGLASRNVAGFDSRWCKMELPADPRQHDAIWELVWGTIVFGLSRQYPGELPTGFGDSEAKTGRESRGVQVSVLTYPAKRWRQRAEDYAAALALLHKLTMTPSGPPKGFEGTTSELASKLKCSDQTIRNRAKDGNPMELDNVEFTITKLRPGLYRAIQNPKK